MPLLNVQLMEGVFTPEQKQEMIRRLTDVIVSIKGESIRQTTWIILNEVKSKEWGVGGQAVSTADVNARAAVKLKE